MLRSAIDWSQLPPELLEKIAGSLDEIADCVRFGAVCKPFRSASKSTHLPRFRAPWLLLMDPKRLPWPEDMRDDEEKARGFLSLSDNKIYTLSLPQTCKMRYSSSAYGWLFIHDASGDKAQISLLNPITKAHVSLRPLNANIAQIGRSYKVIETPEALIAMVNSDRLVHCYQIQKGADGEVAAAAAAAGKWTKLPVCYPNGKIKRPGIRDFTYYGGRYFVLGERESPTLIFDGATCQLTSVILSDGTDRWFHSAHTRKYSFVGRQYLVESLSGEGLFLVIWRPWRTREDRFEVFKLDRREQQTKWTWCKVGSIGSNILYVDDLRAMLLPATNFDGCKGNCVVFYDYDSRSPEEHTWWRAVGRFSLFDIGKGRVGRLPSSCHESIKGWASQGWFFPSLR